MSSAPGFAATPVVGSSGAPFSAATTDKTGATTTNIKDVLTGVAAGTKIDELRVVFDGNPADCTVLWFLYDGARYTLFEDWDVGDQPASSTTVAAYAESREYPSLYLPSASWKIAVAVTVSPTSGTLVGYAFGASL